jgi:hypothetical protein
MTRLINDENVIVDEDDLSALGIGGTLKLSAGYKFIISRVLSISPQFSVDYAPFFWMPNAEALINQTIGMSGSKNTALLMGNFGIKVHYQIGNAR